MAHSGVPDMGQRGPTRLSQRLILKWANKTNPVILVVVVVLGFGETRGVDYPTARGLYVEDPIKTNG